MLISSETGGVRVYEAASWQSINLGKFGTPHFRVARLQKYLVFYEQLRLYQTSENLFKMKSPGKSEGKLNLVKGGREALHG